MIFIHTEFTCPTPRPIRHYCEIERKKINVEWLPYGFRFYTRKLHMITHCKPRHALVGASDTPTSLVRTSTSVSTAGKSTINWGGYTWQVRCITFHEISSTGSKNIIRRVADKKREINNKIQVRITRRFC